MSDWLYGGPLNYKGRDATVWTNEVKMYGRVEYYNFYVSTDGHPLYLSVMGQDWFTGSHFDQYIAEFDYDSWKAGPIDPEVFVPPGICTGDQSVAVQAGVENTPGSRMQALIPRFIRGVNTLSFHRNMEHVYFVEFPIHPDPLD